MQGSISDIMTIMTRENAQKVWLGSKYVATPVELNAQYAPFVPAETEDVENMNSDDVEAEDSLHREIREIEKGVSREEREVIHKEIHNENFKRFQKDETLGKDINGHEKIEAETKKRWFDLRRADEIKKEAEDILDKSPAGSLGQWDTLREEEKKGFFEAKTVQDILDVLKGKTVVQRWFKKGK